MFASITDDYELKRLGIYRDRRLIFKFTFPKFISTFSFFPIGLRRDKKVSQGRSIANQKDIN